MLFAFVGVLGLLSDLLPGTIDQGRLLPVLLDASNLGLGVIAWVLPWSRLPHQSRLVLPVLAFASVAANSATGVLPIATIGIWYVLVFVWTGLWSSPRTVLAFGPIALAAYLVPFGFGAPQTGGAVTAVILVIPVAVLVGVSIARKTASERARRAAEDRLRPSWKGRPSTCSPATGRARSPSTRRARPSPGRLCTPGSRRPGIPGARPWSVDRSSRSWPTTPPG